MIRIIIGILCAIILFGGFGMIIIIQDGWKILFITLVSTVVVTALVWGIAVGIMEISERWF